MRFQNGVLATFAVLTLVSGPASAEEVNLLGLGDGAMPVVEAPSFATWPAVQMIDDAPRTGWASQSGKVSNNVFVFELPVPGTPARFEFDTASIDGASRGAKDVIVEVSAVSTDAGFESVLRASLADKKDGQVFPAATSVEGRFVRLTIVNNHGDSKYCELMGFRAFGTRGAAPAGVQVVGTFDTNYNKFHLRQQGTAISGCYEHREGLFAGTVEGRVAKLTWTQSGGKTKGPAVFLFSPDGKSFRGYWWVDTDKAKGPNGSWTGRRASADVGGCPHWSGSVGGQLRSDLASQGRARLNGILFDTDSARLRAESLPTLDEVIRVLAGEPSWSVLIEGHTDSTSTAAHNQALSEQRAKSVLTYLTEKGVAASRLSAVGFGQSRPVADNATELGRAQNRRVELVRK
jgi:outer membrane protein OmpA-like peptidoglycan-associated protein